MYVFIVCAKKKKLMNYIILNMMEIDLFLLFSDGLDFYYSSKQHAQKMVDFLQCTVPSRYSTVGPCLEHSELWGAVPNPSFQNNCVNASVRNLYFSQNRQNPSYKGHIFSTFHGKIYFYFLNIFICAKDTLFQGSLVPGNVPVFSWKLFSSFTGPSHPNVWSPTTFTAMSTTTKALSLWKLFPYAR